MQIKLPVSGHKVELLDYYTQGAYEAHSEALSKGKENEANQPVTDDDILRDMGVEYVQQINQAQGAEKDQLRRAAERRVRSSRMTGGMTVKDYHRAEHAKILAMIISVDAEQADERWLSTLHRGDYKKLEDYVKEKEDEADAEKKS